MPLLRKNWKTKVMEPSYKDEPPTPIQIDACLPRLHEEIYLVDPIVIVALGPVAAKALMQRPVAITSPHVRGQPAHITIPGAGFQTVRTDKKQAWVRAKGKVIDLPVEQSEVRYLCIPTHDLSIVHRRLADLGVDGPFRQLANDVQKAVQIYERYMLEIFGTLPSGAADGELQFTYEEVTANRED
jgi:hypothetical protein